MRLYLLKDMVKLPVMMYVREVLLKVILVMCISFVLPMALRLSMQEGWLRLITICAIGTIITALVEFRIGLTTNERLFVTEKLKKIKIIQELKSKYLKMKDLLTISGGVKTDRSLYISYAFCLCYNKQVSNFKQEAYR